MLFPVPNQVPDWVFVETWIDPTSRIPYVLILVADESGIFKVYDPKENYREIFSSNDYNEVKMMLREDEYERVEGRIQDSETLANLKSKLKELKFDSHNRIQNSLTELINSMLKVSKLAWAFTELRCTFSNKSLVPDIAVFRWENIPSDERGEIASSFITAPNWIIEILPQNQNRGLTQAMKNIVACLEAGTEMGWLIHPEERSVFVYFPDKIPMIFDQDDQVLPVPEFAHNLAIKTQDIFACLLKE